MTQEQFDLIVKHHFFNINGDMINACRDVIMNDMTAYAAENKHGVTRGTVSRCVRRIMSEYDYANEVVKHAS